MRNIILNPNYCGRVINQYGQYENMFPAIVSTTIYEEAQVTRTQKQVKRKPSENQLKQKSNVLLPFDTHKHDRPKTKSFIALLCLSENMNNARFV